MTTLMLIDGNSLAYRAYYALPAMFTSQNIPTNALHGFLAMFFNLVETKQPDLLAVCFDKGKKTFRNQLFSDYKGKRKATPDDLRQQFPLLKKLLQTMGVKTWELEDYEADDLIGSLSRWGEENHWHNLIVTGDQDALQLVSSQTTVLLTARGTKDLTEYNLEAVRQKFGLEPEMLIDYKGLCGDVSDNIPGLPGVGPKTASNLLKKYGSLPAVLEQQAELTPKLQKIVGEYGEQALLSQKLATIVRNLDLQANPEELAWQGPEYEAIAPLFLELELKTHLKRLAQKNTPAEAPAEIAYQAVSLAEILSAPDLAWGLAVSQQAEQIWLSFSQGEKAALIELKLENQAALAEILAKVPVIGWDLKKIARLLAPWDLKIKNPAFDPAIATYLLNPSRPPEKWEQAAWEYLQSKPENEAFPDSLIKEAQAVEKLRPILEQKLEQMDLADLYWQMEHPLIAVLTQMELNGIKVNWTYLQELSQRLTQQLEQIAQDIYLLAGEEFNLNSPKQLAGILFDKLGLPAAQKTKTGASTKAEVLEKLAQDYPIAALMLEYRALAKLKSTYLEGLFPLADPKTGFLHTTFHQNITATGRLSSSNPNLQNIPVRTPQGREIREAFEPRYAGNQLLGADYSQIELRILAHLSGDSLFMEAFQKGEDIHTRTASEIFGIPLEAIDNDLRKKAKAINFGIIYGMGAFKLAQDTHISVAKAQDYIANYFERYQGIKAFIDQTISEARQQGLVRTMFKRLRYLPEIQGSNHFNRALGERTAVNTPIQGTAADLIKLAMLGTARELAAQKLKSQILLQVHDELILEVWSEELEIVAPLVKKQMEQAAELKVPLVADLKLGLNWNQMNKFNS